MNKREERKNQKRTKYLIIHARKKNEKINRFAFQIFLLCSILYEVVYTLFVKQPYIYTHTQQYFALITTRLKFNRICIYIYNILSTHTRFMLAHLLSFILNRFTHSIVSHAILFQFERRIFFLLFSAFISIIILKLFDFDFLHWI